MPFQRSQKSKPILKEVAADSSDVDLVELLLLAPFRKSTWIMVDALSLDAQKKILGKGRALVDPRM